MSVKEPLYGFGGVYGSGNTKYTPNKVQIRDFSVTVPGTGFSGYICLKWSKISLANADAQPCMATGPVNTVKTPMSTAHHIFTFL